MKLTVSAGVCDVYAYISFEDRFLNELEPLLKVKCSYNDLPPEKRDAVDSAIDLIRNYYCDDSLDDYY